MTQEEEFHLEQHVTALRRFLPREGIHQKSTVLNLERIDTIHGRDGDQNKRDFENMTEEATETGTKIEIGTENATKEKT